MSVGALVFYALWAGLAGGLIPIMATLNGSLGRSIGAPYYAALISVALAFAAVLATLLVVRPALPTVAALASAPKIAFFGGLAIGFYALTATFITPKFGVGNVVICVVVAQLAVSALIDQFGLFGAPVHLMDLRRAGGLALLGVGAVLVAMR